MDLARFMGVQRVSYGIDFYPGDACANLPIKDGFVILNLTAGNSVKEWPLPKFVQLADCITVELDRDVLLSTIDTKAIQEVRSNVQRPDRVYDGSTLNLAQIGDACRKAGAFVSVDTGPMYIAFAMRCPAVVMLGPIHPKEQVPPESERVTHVLPPQGCKPWVHISLTPRKGTEEQLRCARDTPVEDAIAGLKTVLL
jgi:ADP-heptose:LPS heptosyltransferase